MTQSFEFEVVENLAANQGVIEGYFGVGDYKTDIGPAIIRTGNRSPENTGIVPVVLDEFAQGASLNMDLIPHFWNKINGIVTFGTDASKLTHLSIVSRELAADRPGLLAVLLQLPEGMTQASWKSRSSLSKIQGHFGTVTVEGSVCKIDVNEAVPPLSMSLEDYFDELDDDEDCN